MTYFHKVRQLFLYAGVEKEEYQMLLPSIREENRLLLKVFSQLSAVMFFLLFIASMMSTGFASENRMTYLVCALEMLFILFCSHAFLPKYPTIVMLLVYIFEILLYFFAIHISMLHADKPAVSAVAFLLVSPLLFYDSPIRLSVMIAAVVTFFCWIAVRFKTPEIAVNDVWNLVTFGFVAVATTVFTMSIKMRSLAQSRQITYLSQTDLLTGLKNRNHYENQLHDYPKRCSSNLVCVYADVNGLHEMNNINGHPKGDKMLREVAEAMQMFFGPEHTYRIGGDEFIGFQMDGQPENLPREIDQLRDSLAQKGYHVSFGIAVRDKELSNLNMFEIVNEAEINMFADKREYYQRIEIDRRAR